MNVFEKIEVIDFEDFSEDKFGKEKDELTLICMSTHYEGDPCDNTVQFHKFIKNLKKQRNKTALENL